jgi:hypothetical protein
MENSTDRRLRSAYNNLIPLPFHILSSQICPFSPLGQGPFEFDGQVRILFMNLVSTDVLLSTRCSGDIIHSYASVVH